MSFHDLLIESLRKGYAVDVNGIFIKDTGFNPIEDIVIWISAEKLNQPQDLLIDVNNMDQLIYIENSNTWEFNNFCIKPFEM